MINKRLQRLVAKVLLVAMLFNSTSIVSLAKSADANTNTQGMKDSPAVKGSKSSGSGTTVFNEYGGGYKISFISAVLNTYAPSIKGESPLYTDEMGKGVTPISINGTRIPAGYNSGEYGIAPIYLAGTYSHTNELAVDSSMNVGIIKDSFADKRITEKLLISAAKSAGVKDSKVPGDIYKAFNQVNIMKSTRDINEYLQMTSRVEEPNMSEAQMQRNQDVLATLVHAAIIRYGKNTEIGIELKNLLDNNLQDRELIVLIEPLAHVTIRGKGISSTPVYITPANYILATSNLSVNNYIKAANYRDMRGAVRKAGGFKGKFQVNFNLHSVAAPYILGKDSGDKYSTALGSGFRGTNPDYNSPLKYRESLFGKVVYAGPLSWEGDNLIRSMGGYKWGFGTLASSDYSESPTSPPTSDVKTSSSSVTILGQKSGLTPQVSVGLTTDGDVTDSVLNDKISKAINDLDIFVNDSRLNINSIDKKLSTEACADILNILVNSYNNATIQETSLSNKQEDITGKIKNILDKSGLDINSLYIARYMNMLIQNGGSNEDGTFTFNTETNKSLIGYLYTLFDPNISNGYGILSKLEDSYKDQVEGGYVTSGNVKNVGVSGNTLDTTGVNNNASKGQVYIFGGLEAGIVSNKTSKDFKDMSGSGLGGKDSLDVPGINSNSTEKEKQEYYSKLETTLVDATKSIVEIDDYLDRAEDAFKLLLSWYTVPEGLLDGKYSDYKDLYGGGSRWGTSEFYPNAKKTESEFNAIKAKIKKELAGVSIPLSLYKRGKSSKYVQDIQVKVDSLYREYTGISDEQFVRDRNLTEGLGAFQRIDSDIVASYTEYNRVMDSLLKEYSGFEELAGIDIKKGNWLTDVKEVKPILFGLLNTLANELGRDVRFQTGDKEWMYKQFNYDYYTASGYDVDSFGDAGRRAVKQYKKVLYLDPSVNMTNSLTSVTTSSYLSEFGATALELSNLTTGKDGQVGVSTETQGIKEDNRVYYSPIVTANSLVLNNGCYGTIKSVGFNNKTMLPEYEIDTAKYNMDELLKDDSDITKEEMLERSIQLPTGSLYAMSDEIQAMLSDYINDCIEYTEWYWSVANKSKTKSEEDLNKKFDNELQYRVGMYLDIIKDTRKGVKYSNMLSNKEAVKHSAKHGDAYLSYDYMWNRSEGKMGKSTRAPYYLTLEDDRGRNVLDRLSGFIEDHKGLNKSAITAMTSEDLILGGGKLYFPNMLGTTVAYLSDKTYKFNYLLNSADRAGVDVYVGGAFQYPLSYVKCDMDDLKEFGKDLDIETTFLYSMYSLSDNAVQNTDYFSRQWPISGDTIKDHGRASDVYKISDILIDLIRAGEYVGDILYDADVRSKAGEKISISELVRTVLDLSDNELKIFNTMQGESEKRADLSLSNIADYLSAYDGNYSGAKGKNSPIIMDSLLDESAIALAQYLYDNIDLRPIKDAKLKNRLSSDSTYNTMTGNGGFDVTISNILNATTTKKSLSWDKGIDIKLADDATVRGAYKNILRSIISGAKFTVGDVSNKEYINKLQLIKYQNDGLSYGKKSKSGAGGLAINNEVFKYYVENIVALSTITKNNTAVYVADDGEVKKETFVTALGNTAAKYDFLSNYNERLKEQLDKLEKELGTEDVVEYTTKKEEIIKEETTIKTTYEKTYEKETVTVTDKDAVKKYNGLLEKNTALTKEFNAVYDEYMRMRNYVRVLKDKVKNDPIEQDKLLKEIESTGIAKNQARRVYEGAFRAVNNAGSPLNSKISAKVESSSVKIKDISSFVSFMKSYRLNPTRYSKCGCGKTCNVSDHRKYAYYKEAINHYMEFNRLVVKYEDLHRKLGVCKNDIRIYNADYVKAEIVKLDKLIVKVNDLSNQREALEAEINTLKNNLTTKKIVSKEVLTAINEAYTTYTKETIDVQEQLTAHAKNNAKVESTIKKIGNEMASIVGTLKLEGSRVKSDKTKLLVGPRGHKGDFRFNDFIKLNNLRLTNNSPNGNYIFNITLWEYEDDDSGAVVYLPGNSNAIMNPSKLGVGKSNTDNKDDRISELYGMKAFGDNEETLSQSIDSIASLVLQQGALKSTNINMVNLIYSNGSWPLQAITNVGGSTIVASNTIMDKDIPIDAQIIEVDDNGNILKYHDLIKEFSSISSNVMSTIDIAESFTLGGIEVEVQHIALSPTVKNKNIYELPKGIGKNILKAIQSKDPSKIDLMDGLGVPDIVSHLQSMDKLEYVYETISGKETIKGKYLAALTDYDRKLYEEDVNAHPILILLVKVKEPIKQINIVENTEADALVLDVEPKLNAKETVATLDDAVKVRNSTGTGVGELIEWITVETKNIPPNLSGWGDILKKDTINSGKGTVVQPVEGGNTIIARYVEERFESATGDLLLEQNEISKRYAISSYDKDNITMMSKIGSADNQHEHDNGYYVSHTCGKTCSTPCTRSGWWRSNWVSYNYTLAIDKSYEHVYDVVNYDKINPQLISKSDSVKFNPKISNNTTGKSNTTMNGTSSIVVKPNYTFVLWRGYDKPTLASFKNSKGVIKELGELGLTEGTKPNSRIVDTGACEKLYELDIVIGKDSKSGDYKTTWACPKYNSESHTQRHIVAPDLSHKADTIIKTYTGKKAPLADDASDNEANIKFDIAGRKFNTAMGFSIPNDNDITFYPYVKMVYSGMDNKSQDAYVLSTNLSKINITDYVDIGYSKQLATTLNLESDMWSNHMRSINFLADKGLKDRYSILPGGATYTLDTLSSKTLVGIRTWQTILPNNTIDYVQAGKNRFKPAEVDSRRNSLIGQLEKSLESYDIVQYVAQGTLVDPAKIAKDGVLLNKISSGSSQTVFGNRLSSEKKYYLKTKTPTASDKADEADLDVIESKQVRQITYTIKSDTAGKVWVEKDGSVIASITKTQGLGQLLANKEVKELDDKTKLVTNYLESIDRNKGNVKDETWYNEAWDGISVLMTEHTIEVGFNKPGIRTCVLDTKLVGRIDSKSDLYNYKDQTKVRTSIFRTSINNNINNKPRWVATWGDTDVDIIIRGIENMLISKPFYIPNATVQDN